MKLEGGSISSFQLIFIIIGFTFGSSVIIMTGGSAEHDVWLAILAGLGEGLFFVFIFTTLALRFPGTYTFTPFSRSLAAFFTFLWWFRHLPPFFSLGIIPSYTLGSGDHQPQRGAKDKIF